MAQIPTQHRNKNQEYHINEQKKKKIGRIERTYKTKANSSNCL